MPQTIEIEFDKFYYIYKVAWTARRWLCQLQVEKVYLLLTGCICVINKEDIFRLPKNTECLSLLLSEERLHLLLSLYPFYSLSILAWVETCIASNWDV